MRNIIRNYFAALIAFLVSPIWNLYFIGILQSFGGVIIKAIECNGFAIAGTRGALAVIFQLIYLKVRRQSFKFPRHWVGWLAAVSFSANTILLVWAFRLTLAGNAISLHYMGMALGGLFAPLLLKEELGLRNIVAIALIIGSIALVTEANLKASLVLLAHTLKTGSLSGFHNANIRGIIGDILGVLCGVTLAAEVICFRFIAEQERQREEAPDPQLEQRPDVLHIIMTSDLLTALVSTLVLIFMPPEDQHLFNMYQNWHWLVVLAIVPWFLPNILYCFVVKRVPSLIKAMIGWSLEPVLTVVWVAIYSYEFPGYPGILGGLIILCVTSYSRVGEVSAPQKEVTLT